MVLDCDVHAIQAFAEVEAGPYGPWMPDGDHPVVLFERHVFCRLTHGVYDDVEPGLSNPKPGGYGAHADQPARLARARELDDEAAVKATSWGLFQVMGFNHRLAGYAVLADFEASMREEVCWHLGAFACFVGSQPKLAAAIRRHDWWTAARLYNGKDHAKHDYAGRLTRAYQRHASV
jgi:hypothetical protein